MLTSSQKTFQTYIGLVENTKAETYLQDFSIFLLSLDLNGQNELATLVWEEVTLEYLSRGEDKAWEKLREYKTTVFGSPS